VLAVVLLSAANLRGVRESGTAFAEVAGDAKQGLVNEVFTRVARRYDLMNDLMSGGLHRPVEKRASRLACAAEKPPFLTPFSTLPGAPAMSPSDS